MKEFAVKFYVNGKEFTQESLDALELKRCRFALREMFSVGLEPQLNGTKISEKEIDSFDIEEAKNVLAETRALLSVEDILSAYKEKLSQSDAFWKDISEKSQDRKNFKQAIVEVEANGITIPDFAKMFQHLEEKGDIKFATKMHPEHHIFFVGENRSQYVMENLCTTDFPTYIKLALITDGYEPIERDEDTAMAMSCECILISDGTKTKIYVMHQFKPMPNGIKVKLGLFLPEAAPDTLIEGHQHHFLVEFRNFLKTAFEMAQK